jgi:hypothetical protein
MAFLYNKEFLNPNHYVSSYTYPEIQQCVEESCGELQIDSTYNPYEYSYECITYYKYREIGISINLFSFQSNLIIEIEHVSGDGFGYTKIVSELRYKWYKNGIIYSQYEPYVEEKESSKEEISPEYIRSLVDSCSSTSYSIQLDSIYLLANLSCVNKPIMIQPYVLENVIKLCGMEDSTICRCALPILSNFLNSEESEWVAGFL